MKNIREIVVDGSQFARARESGVTSEKLADGILERLCKLIFDKSLSETDRSEAIGIIATRDEENKRCIALFERVEQQRQTSLIEEHEALKVQCRQKRTELEKLKDKINELEQRITSMQIEPSAAYQKTLTSLKIAQAELESLDQFATRKEIAAAKAKVADAETAFDREDERIEPLQGQINQLSLHALLALQAEYNELVQRELELGAEIDGKSFTDSFGIVHPGPQPVTL
jgi:hypothetical protein